MPLDEKVEFLLGLELLRFASAVVLQLEIKVGWMSA